MKVFILICLCLVLCYGNPGAESTTWKWKPKTPKVAKNFVPRNSLASRLKSSKFERSENSKAGIVQEESLGIVNGNEVTPHSYPWQAGLFIDELYFCGGALISDEWVLTAGHCTTGSRVIRVVLGAHDLTKDEPTQVTIIANGGDIITHEEYGAALLANDIGLVHLSKKVNFTSAIQPINLPSASEPDLGSGVLLTATGWGVQSDAFNATDSATLFEVTNPSITNDECSEPYGPIVTDNTICTDTLPNNQGTCTGDSGGPLNYVVDGKTYSRGITSFVSSKGCESGQPDGFTRTTHFLNWINEKTGIEIDP